MLYKNRIVEHRCSQIGVTACRLSLTYLFMFLSHLLTQSLCQLTTLTIHNPLSLSLPAQYLPLSQIFPITDSFQPQD